MAKTVSVLQIPVFVLLIIYRSDWALKLIENENILNAINAGRDESDCKAIFHECFSSDWFNETHWVFIHPNLLLITIKNQFP